MRAKVKQIAVFGTYRKSALYSRNKVLISCLKSSGWSVVEYNTSSLRNKKIYDSEYSFPLIRAILQESLSTLLLFKYLFKLRNEKIILVPYPSIFSIYFVKLMMLGKQYKLIADVFISLVDTVFDDRNLVDASVIKRLIFTLEKQSFRLSDALLIDTESHKQSICHIYNINKYKVHTIPVGIDENTWLPIKERIQFKGKLNVIYWGTYIPLHGLKNLVGAISLLKDKLNQFEFTFVGNGQCYEEIESMIKRNDIENIRLVNKILTPEELYKLAIQNDLVLGIFGTSTKASNVVPYKVNQALAANLPVFTKYSPSYSELMHSNSMYYVNDCTPEEIASKLIDIYQQFKMGIHKTDNRAIYETYYSNATIETKLNDILTTLFD